MSDSQRYAEELRLTKSLLIVTSLQKRIDLKAVKLIREYQGDLAWQPLSNLGIDPKVWKYAVDIKKFDPKLVFCHPAMLLHHPVTSVYYRGLCGLSLKAVRDYFGSVDKLEEGSSRAGLRKEKATKMARTYNAYISAIIGGSTDWTLENGSRTVIATLGITLDGKMRNKVGEIAEERIRSLILEWLIDKRLLVAPRLRKEDLQEALPNRCHLKKDTLMIFGSEPDISFTRKDELLATVEIKGGIDPAGALERYGAATKSFQSAVKENPHCKNFYLGAVFTNELNRRIKRDRLVEKTFDVIEILNDAKTREEFSIELFHHALRLIWL